MTVAPGGDERTDDALRQAAETGDPAAMCAWGARLERGRGDPDTQERIHHWYRRAAEARHPVAMARWGVALAGFVQLGLPNTQAEEAVGWLVAGAEALSAAADDDAEAAYWRAVLACDAAYPTYDLPLAHEALSRAAALGSLKARCWLATLVDDSQAGFPGGRPVAEAHARIALPELRAHAVRYPGYAYVLGDFLTRGLGLPTDTAAGEAWIERAADDGVERALFKSSCRWAWGGSDGLTDPARQRERAAAATALGYVYGHVAQVMHAQLGLADAPDPDLEARIQALIACHEGRSFGLQSRARAARLAGGAPTGTLAAERAWIAAEEEVRRRQAEQLAGDAPTLARTIPVAASDDLAARIAAAPAGAVLSLAAGTWTLAGRVNVVRDLTLVGSGPETTWLCLGGADGGLLVSDGARLELRELALRPAARAWGDLLRVEAGRLVARVCRFEGARAGALAAVSPGGMVATQRSGAALQARPGGRGIRVEAAGSLELEGCAFADHAVAALDLACPEARLQGLTIQASNGFGMLARGSFQGELSDACLDTGRRPALALSDEAVLQMYFCRVRAEGQGLVLGGRASLNLHSSRLEVGRGHALVVDDDARLWAHRVRVVGPGCGAWLDGRAHADLLACRFDLNRGRGLIVRGQATWVMKHHCGAGASREAAIAPPAEPEAQEPEFKLSPTALQAPAAELAVAPDTLPTPQAWQSAWAAEASAFQAAWGWPAPALVPLPDPRLPAGSWGLWVQGRPAATGPTTGAAPALAAIVAAALHEAAVDLLDREAAAALAAADPAFGDVAGRLGALRWRVALRRALAAGLRPPAPGFLTALAGHVPALPDPAVSATLLVPDGLAPALTEAGSPVAIDEDLPRRVLAAPAGATLVLGPGVYRLPAGLALPRDIILVGAGAGLTRLEGGQAGYLLRTHGGEVTLRGLSLVYTGLDPGNVITAAGGRLVLDGCIVAGARSSLGPGPWRPGARTFGIGLQLAQGVQAEIRGCCFINCGEFGVWVCGDSEARLVACVVERCRYGFVAGDDAKLKLSGCRASRNGIKGLFAWGQAHVEAHELVLARNNIGADFCEAATSDLRDLRTEQNLGTGLLVRNTATLTLTGGRVTGNGGTGVMFSDTSSGQVLNVDVRDNAGYGLLAAEDAAPALAGLTFAGNRLADLAWRDSAAGSAQDCHFAHRAGPVLALEGSPRPTLGPALLALADSTDEALVAALDGLEHLQAQTLIVDPSLLASLGPDAIIGALAQARHAAIAEWGLVICPSSARDHAIGAGRARVLRSGEPLAAGIWAPADAAISEAVDPDATVAGLAALVAQAVARRPSEFARPAGLFPFLKGLAIATPGLAEDLDASGLLGVEVAAALGRLWTAGRGIWPPAESLARLAELGLESHEPERLAAGLGTWLAGPGHLGLPPSPAHAQVRRGPAAEEPIALPLGSLADVREAAGDPDGALAAWREAAEAGDTTAMVRLAEVLARCVGRATDAGEAARWFVRGAPAARAAARTGDREAAWALGLAAVNAGTLAGSPKYDGAPHRDRRWLAKAAQAGHPFAMCLAVLQEHCDLSPRTSRQQERLETRAQALYSTLRPAWRDDARAVNWGFDLASTGLAGSATMELAGIAGARGCPRALTTIYLRTLIHTTDTTSRAQGWRALARAVALGDLLAHETMIAALQLGPGAPADLAAAARLTEALGRTASGQDAFRIAVARAQLTGRGLPRDLDAVLAAYPRSPLAADTPRVAAGEDLAAATAAAEISGIGQLYLGPGVHRWAGSALPDVTLTGAGAGETVLLLEAAPVRLPAGGQTLKDLSLVAPAGRDALVVVEDATFCLAGCRLGTPPFTVPGVGSPASGIRVLGGGFLYAIACRFEGFTAAALQLVGTGHGWVQLCAFLGGAGADFDQVGEHHPSATISDCLFEGHGPPALRLAGANYQTNIQRNLIRGRGPLITLGDGNRDARICLNLLVPDAGPALDLPVDFASDFGTNTLCLPGAAAPAATPLFEATQRC